MRGRLGLAVALLGVIAGLAFWRGGREEGAATVGEPPPPTPDAAAVAMPPPPLPPANELPEPVRRWLDANAYPPTSGPLTAAHEDLLRPNRRHERRRPVPDSLSDDPESVVSYLFTADRFYYTGADTVHASLRGWRGAETVALRVLSARAEPEGRGGVAGGGRELGFVWEDDRLVADLPLTRFPEHHGPILLTVHFEYEPGRRHEASIRVFNTPVRRIPARLTGEFREDVDPSRLRIEVGAEVDEAGFYRFDANLRDAAGDPVAFTSFKGELERGRGFVPLEVFGKVLRDVGTPGPWTLSEIRGYRFLEARYPDRERLPDSDLTWRTGVHDPARFSGDASVSEHHLRMVQLMLEDLERGIPLEAPSLPAPGERPGPRPPDDDAEVALPEARDPER